MKIASHLKQLNFDSEYHINYVGYVLFTIGMVAFGISLYSNMQTLKQIAVAREEVAHIQSLSTSTKRTKANIGDPEAHALMDKITKQVRYPWDDFFSTLEAIHTREVSLISIQPNFEKKEVLISAEAESLQRMLAYISVFERQKNIDHVELLSQELMDDNQQGRISFAIMAELL